METNKILTADLLDLIFDERNKDYGAYELRRTYEKRIKKALFITAFIGTLGFTSTILANKLAPDKSDKQNGPGFLLTAVEEKKPEPPPEIPKPQLPPPAQPPVETLKFTAPVITDGPIEEPMETQEDLNRNVNIGAIKVDGPENGGEFQKPEDIDVGTGMIEGPKTPAHTGPFEKVEIEARYPGDWGRFLERNLRADVAVENGAPPGMYTVYIQFIVDAEGNISDMKPLTSHGYGMEEEAIRVIKKTKSTKWIPAFQNSQHVPAYRKQPVTFKIE